MSKADQTRLTILSKALELVYRNGYQSTSVDDIIANTKVTKGAFYYHFSSKDDMGLAMINDVMYPGMREVMIKPLIQSAAPITDLYKMMETLLKDEQHFDVAFGCPAINLIEEMSPLNAEFNKALSKLSLEWQKAIQASVEQGKVRGVVRAGVDSKQVAHFVIAGYGGIRNLGKVFGRACYTTYLKELKNYLQTLA
ncbi:TetR/AcrR family transcriptional regulator [Chitinophaga pendula]|uniref:TetR/AcrR family transcriptional regulator n=1 Tax=Chitinophaga TaxID=79328 RepID=UPI000BAEFABD|nr:MULTISPECIES: TetR/AcrR family transcriptional regulator [Chitinophaga]ASZ13988.1 TetR family transcriptional regulator [Chitinophaga sp. MD30]UCJ08388.1 TetR/AcrR family transcriptional regulator [Chitinophaga pendula]